MTINIEYTPKIRDAFNRLSALKRAALNLSQIQEGNKELGLDLSDLNQLMSKHKKLVSDYKSMIHEYESKWESCVGKCFRGVVTDDDKKEFFFFVERVRNNCVSLIIVDGTIKSSSINFFNNKKSYNLTEIKQEEFISLAQDNVEKFIRNFTEFIKPFKGETIRLVHGPVPECLFSEVSKHMTVMDIQNSLDELGKLMEWDECYTDDIEKVKKTINEKAQQLQGVIVSKSVPDETKVYLDKRKSCQGRFFQAKLINGVVSTEILMFPYFVCVDIDNNMIFHDVLCCHPSSTTNIVYCNHTNIPIFTNEELIELTQEEFINKTKEIINKTLTKVFKL